MKKKEKYYKKENGMWRTAEGMKGNNKEWKGKKAIEKIRGFGFIRLGNMSVYQLVAVFDNPGSGAWVM